VLDGLEVVEIGDTVASAAAGALCRRLGAKVAKASSRTPATVATRPATQRERLRELLDRDKTWVRTPADWVSDAAALTAGADITIVDLSDSSWRDTPDRIQGYRELVSRHNTGSWATISPFGLEGPLSSHRGSELTIVASGGMANYTRSSLGRPTKPAGFTASITAGHFAVLSALHGLMLRRDGAGPVHLDVSAQDTVIVTGVFLECAHRLFDCSGEGGAARYAAPRGLIPCGSGFVWIVVLEDHQWRACLEGMGDPSWAEGIRSSEDRHREQELIQQKLIEWASAFTAREVSERLQACGVPATPVNSCSDLLGGIGLDVRDGFFVDGTASGERLPDLPFESIPRAGGATEHRDDATDRPARRYRLLDLTQVLVGPLATSWLGAMGIDVLKIEDPDRTDVYRRRGPFLGDEPGLERSAYFSFANYSKRSHAVSLGTPEGRERLDRLVASADVVVHNLVQRALTLGLTPAHVHGELGSFLVSCSGYGRTTRYATHRAYGMNIQAAGGVVHLTRDRRGQPVNLGTSWADPLSSVWIAITTLAQLLRPECERQSIDISMVEVVAYEFREYFQAQTADSVELLGDESRLDHAAPHGIYRCHGEDRWFALSIETDAEWKALLQALDSPAALDLPAWSTFSGRLAAQDELDEALDGALADRAAWDLHERLQAAGIVCAPVLGAADLVSLEHLHARGLFQRVQHPVWGERPLIGLPWLVNGQPAPIAATPILGIDTTDDPRTWWTS
jgi:crotonobetainyl-CoA:carnitine CoA-transferase CaiB-like acyl-CoA transferase